MKKIYNVVRYRNTDKLVYGDNKKISKKKNSFTKRIYDATKVNPEAFLFINPDTLEEMYPITFEFTYDDDLVQQFKVNYILTPFNSNQKINLEIINAPDALTLDKNSYDTISYLPNQQPLNEQIVFNLDRTDTPEENYYTLYLTVKGESNDPEIAPIETTLIISFERYGEYEEQITNEPEDNPEIEA